MLKGDVVVFSQVGDVEIKGVQICLYPFAQKGYLTRLSVTFLSRHVTEQPATVAKTAAAAHLGDIYVVDLRCYI